jgi:HPt (histidine-containing phosphotransfer) domain-containing protein
MDDYLAKPLDFGELLTLLESWLPPVTRTAPLLSPELSKAFDSQHGEADCGLVPVRQTDFNMRKFVERNLGNSELSRAVAILFCDTVPEYLSAIQTAATAQDAGALLRAAHKLKGAASNLELSSLSEAAAVIESLARSGNLENSATLIHDLEQRLAQAVTALHELTGTELDRGKKRHEYSDR